jgi:DNA-binding MarR family transcriptional regulator
MSYDGAQQGAVVAGLENVADTVFRTGASFDAFTAQMRRAFDLNAHERLAISLLWARGPQSMTELGTGIPLSRAAVTTLVDRLEAARLVRRRTDENDRRRTVVEVTQDALDRMLPVIKPYLEALGHLAARRSSEEWETISRFLAEFTVLNDEHAGRLTALGDGEIQALAQATT